MKLFIYEHITSGALINTALPASLEREGNMMLHAIVEDFLRITDIEITILRDGRLSNMTIANSALKCLNTDSEYAFQKAYNNARQQADYILAIAPETDGILFDIQDSIMTEKGKSLGSQANAIAISTDKYQCYQILQEHAIPTPLSVIASEWPLLKFSSASGYITKPRDGAGCVNTLFFPNQSTLSLWLKKQDDHLDQFIIQPYFVGTSISLSLLCSEQGVSVLSLNHQHVSEKQGVLSFSGCTVNGTDISKFTIEQASILAQKVHQA
ncbi:ATP-grasp domain-containing protein, partial [Pseudomonadota bacterium]|nr:ATP-grasp domain-containing protein [Pseudomonadota bacterium]